MMDNIRLLKIDLKEYFDDILGLIIVGLGTNGVINFVVTLSTRKLPEYLKYIGIVIPKTYDYFPLSIDWIKIAIWIITYLFIRKWLLHKVRPCLNKFTGRKLFENRYCLDISRFDMEWEYQGNVAVTKEGLQITNTPSGCFIKNDFWDTKIWDNFSATFNVTFNTNLGLEDDYIDPPVNNLFYIGKYLKPKKIEFRKVLGVVFRAQNLDDYFMLGIWIVEKNIIFRPHLRVSGNLDIPLHNPQTNIFALINIPEVFEFKVLARKNKVKIYIKENGDWKICFCWLLPTHYKSNLNEGRVDDNTSGIITRKIPFRDSYGMFGFRNYGNEFAAVKSLKINGNFSEEENKLFHNS